MAVPAVQFLRLLGFIVGGVHLTNKLNRARRDPVASVGNAPCVRAGIRGALMSMRASWIPFPEVIHAVLNLFLKLLQIVGWQWPSFGGW